MQGTSKLQTVLTVLFIQVIVSRRLKVANDFRVAECVWDGYKYSEINDFSYEPVQVEKTDCTKFSSDCKLTDANAAISEWPPGPYALPMPIDGCPETREKGWTQGYIEFTWKEPVAVFSPDKAISENSFNTETLKELRDITLTQPPNIQSNLIGPYSRYKVKINFCFKIVRNVSLDRGYWPDGNYSIYGDTSGCPDGFVRDTVDIQLGKITHWISDGGLPHFTVNRTDKSADSLQLLQCSRIPEDNMAAELFPPRESFIILKNKDDESSPSTATPCASLTGMGLHEEFLYFSQTSSDADRSAHMPTPFLAFCYYFPKEFPMGYKRYVGEYTVGVPIPNDSFVVKVMDVTTGKISKQAGALPVWQNETGMYRNDMLNQLPRIFNPTAREMWKVIDLGRSMFVIALFVSHRMEYERFRGKTEVMSMSRCNDITRYKCQQWNSSRPLYRDSAFPDYSSAAAGNNCRDPSKKGHLYCILWDYQDYRCDVFRWTEPDGTFPKCFISVGKWDFLHFSAFSCRFEVYYDDDPNNDGFYMILYRTTIAILHNDVRNTKTVVLTPLLGRYVSLVGGAELYSDHSYMDIDTTVNVITNKEIFQENSQCNMDLGMADETIADSQISSSSSLHGFPAAASRPFRSSWCANPNDPLRFITVDLGTVLKVESITVLNWEDISETIANGTINKRFLPIGTRSFSISFGKEKDKMSTYDDKIFRLDALYRVDKPQKFILYKQVHSRFVRIHVKEPLTENLYCLRFEINGCRAGRSRVSAYTAVQRSLYFTNATLLQTVDVISEESVITSIGYPFNYASGESYKWIIKFKMFEMIRLIFTNISFNIYQQRRSRNCDDSIVFNEEVDVYNVSLVNGYDNNIVLNRNFGRRRGQLKIDSSYNGRIISLGTKITFLTLTFTSCHHVGSFLFRGHGVRALVLKEDIPECFTLETFRQHGNEHVEYCEMPIMTLSSMSYFNIPFKGLSERWIIKRSKGYLRLVVKHFDIKCNTGSRLSIKDKFTSEKKFCNIIALPNVYFTSSGSVNVTFTKYNSNSTEFFRIVYYSVEELVPETITTKAASIPDIYQSIAREADEAGDTDLNNIIATSWEVTGYDESVPRLLYKACSKRFDKCYSIFSVYASWTYAGKECWIRKQRLVSIQSLDELNLVKYIMRNFKFLNIESEMFQNAFRHNKTDYYYTFIGLHRFVFERDALNFFNWENTTPLTFSAWKKGEPSTGDCVRMGFFKADENNTWETIDCYSASAFYFVCEDIIGDRSIDLQDREIASEYRGNLNVTVRGFTCQRWDTQYPHKHTLNKDHLFPDASVSSAANFCRGPGRIHDVWCYTTDPEVKEDFCYANELLEDYSPRTYKGQFSYPYTGNECAKWSDVADYFSFFNETADDASNYCRIPTSRHVYRNSFGFLWCLTETEEGIYNGRYCSYYATVSDRCATTHYVYDGKWNFTYSGKACSRWDVHIEWKPTDLMFTNKTTAAAENACRDPTNQGFLWCFTSETDDVWETCYVQYGRNLYSETGGFNRAKEKEQVKSYFSCLNGHLVSPHARCNGLVECEDATDEVQCELSVSKLLNASLPLPNQNSSIEDVALFVCNNNERISFLARCDGVRDCNDASDETNCSTSSQETGYNNCALEQLECGDGSCIHLSLVCNFISDCIDGSDEICDYLKCSEDEYSCTNGQCIAKEKRCDAFADCLDKSDEDNCEACVPEITFHCDYVRCLPRRFFCDGYIDCDDGSDEMACDWSDITSCQEWWQIGYRETGMYSVIVDPGSFAEPMTVKCDFDEVLTKNKIHTVFTNVDTMDWEGERIIFTHFYTDFPADGALEMSIDRFIVCTHQIVQSCIPVLQSASEIDDPTHNHTYKDCGCIAANVKLVETPLITSVSYCDSNVTLLEEDMNKVHFKYFYSESYRAVSLNATNTNVDNLRLHVGPMTCTEEYAPETSTISCSEGRNVFPESVRCLYDVDRSQNIIGCRSGSHLQNCELYQCPADTIKCPNSYCVPMRFLCDGKNQCIHGEDEKLCGCEEEDREIIILQEESDNRGPDIQAMAKQLFNPRSVIRHLLYVSDTLPEDMPFKHILRILRIKDKEIKPFDLIDRDYECKYNVTTSDFLNVIQFSEKSTRGLIFVQNSLESQHVAEYMFRNMTKSPKFAIYRVLERALPSKEDIMFPFVKDIHISNWNKLGPLTSRYFPDLCTELSGLICPNAYKCASSKMCITLEEVCDGHIHCIHGDDEQLCNFACPFGCLCNGYAITCDSMYNNSTVIPTNQYPKSTRSLAIRNSIEGAKLLMVTELYFPFLYLLNLSRCGLEEITPNGFARLINLRILDISNNLLTYLSSLVFKGLKHLYILNLDGNHRIASIEAYTFKPLRSLRFLRIAGTRIKTIVSNTFADLELDKLELYGNDFDEIQEFGFGNLDVKHINFESNTVSNFDEGIFTGLSSLSSLRAPAYKFCCVRPNYVPEDKCFPQKDEFSSCEDLMRISALQTMLWLIGLCALLGNIFAVIYRLIYDRKRLKLGYGVFVTNLAVADFLMGLYLIIIAVADAVFRKRYIFMDDYWRNSYWCTFAGILSTLSSEASVVFLCLITLDRLLVIKYPFGQFRFDTKKALLCSAAAWIFALIIAIFPVMHTAYFENKFYKKSGVCIALPLTKDRPPGWLYSVLIFVCLNFVTFVLIALGQWSIYMDIRKSKLVSTQSSRKKDLTVSRNLLLVVSTDFLCWFPIGFIGIMAMSGYVISGDVYAWAAVFILPVNSALNPVLYTLPAILGKKSLTPRTGEQLRNRVKTDLGKRFLAIKNFTCQHFVMHEVPEHGSSVSLRQIMRQDGPIDLKVVFRLSHQIAEIVRVLHDNSLVLGKLDQDTIFVSDKGNQILGHVQINQEPRLCTKQGEKYNDIYKLGLLLESLIIEHSERRKKKVRVT